MVDGLGLTTYEQSGWIVSLSYGAGVEFCLLLFCLQDFDIRRHRLSSCVTASVETTHAGATIKYLALTQIEPKYIVGEWKFQVLLCG